MIPSFLLPFCFKMLFFKKKSHLHFYFVCLQVCGYTHVPVWMWRWEDNLLLLFFLSGGGGSGAELGSSGLGAGALTCRTTQTPHFCFCFWDMVLLPNSSYELVIHCASQRLRLGVSTPTPDSSHSSTAVRLGSPCRTFPQLFSNIFLFHLLLFNLRKIFT